MLDKIDMEILSILKKNSRLSYRQIAKQLHLHPTTVIMRVSKLERLGIIRGYGAYLDLSKLGYEFMGVVQVKIAKGKLVETQEKIAKMQGVVAVYDVTGEYDSVVLIAAKTRESFSRLIKSFLHLPFVEHTNTQVILTVVKPSWAFEPV
ncbi:MAG: Lrp/AsnC family transcriptional regulator [Candidatus Micrarchaeota archaeon]|nr:Lrp/AsnC family transcriptional regulator [Candidatus Micrarchaeota archaeon]